MLVPFRNPFKKLERKFPGLVRTTGDHEAHGVHAPGSFHYRPARWGGVQAYDYARHVGGEDRHKLLVRVGQYFRDAHRVRYSGKRVRELFGPFPFYIKDGVLHEGQFPGHDDHLHLALSD